MQEFSTENRPGVGTGRKKEIARLARKCVYSRDCSLRGVPWSNPRVALKLFGYQQLAMQSALTEFAEQKTIPINEKRAHGSIDTFVLARFTPRSRWF